jgi:hypothetical protein
MEVCCLVIASGCLSSIISMDYTLSWSSVSNIPWCHPHWWSCRLCVRPTVTRWINPLSWQPVCWYWIYWKRSCFSGLNVFDFFLFWLICALLKCLKTLNWFCYLVKLKVPFELGHHFLQSQFLDLWKHLLSKSVSECTFGKKSLRFNRTPIRFITFNKVNLRAILFNSTLHQSWFPLHTLTQCL